MTYSFGDPTISYWLFIIPAVVGLLLGVATLMRRKSYTARFSGWRLAWEMWLSNLLIVAVLFGAFYWYLFWRPFYQLVEEPGGDWAAGYHFPARTVSVDSTQIERIETVTERIPFVRTRGGRQNLRLQLTSGRTLTSFAERQSQLEPKYQNLLEKTGAGE